jgi:hypothetical protein
MCDGEDCGYTVNTEKNCNLFSMIALNLNKDNNLIEIFNEFKKIVTEINENDYSKLEYIVKNTKFEFETLTKRNITW